MDNTASDEERTTADLRAAFDGAMMRLMQTKVQEAMPALCATVLAALDAYPEAQRAVRHAISHALVMDKRKTDQ